MATSFTKDGEEYLWLRGQELRVHRPAAVRHSHPVPPAAASRTTAVHIFDGAAYPMEIHGFADLLPWQVQSATDEAIVLTLAPTA